MSFLKESDRKIWEGFFGISSLAVLFFLIFLLSDQQDFRREIGYWGTISVIAVMYLYCLIMSFTLFGFTRYIARGLFIGPIVALISTFNVWQEPRWIIAGIAIFYFYTQIMYRLKSIEKQNKDLRERIRFLDNKLDWGKGRPTNEEIKSTYDDRHDYK